MGGFVRHVRQGRPLKKLLQRAQAFLFFRYFRLQSVQRLLVHGHLLRTGRHIMSLPGESAPSSRTDRKR